ncbi:unnamed protein product, partial [Phaeothamnion confervicola]
MASTSDDPRVKQGRLLMDEGRRDEAANYFSELLEVHAPGDELNPKLAPIYYLYGHCLLSIAEDSGDMFGSAVQEAHSEGGRSSGADGGDTAPAEASPAPAKAAAGNGTGENTTQESGTGAAAAAAAAGGAAPMKDEADGGGSDDGEGEQEEAASPEDERPQQEEDLETAFSVLDIARVIYMEDNTAEGRKALGDVHLRLGDLFMFNGVYQQVCGNCKDFVL